jgi:hypothetical protein
MLQQVVGGYRVIDLAELKVRPARNRAGLPLIIPAGVRVRISRDRDIRLIKLWMSLFGLYRILKFPSFVKVGTIVEEGVNIDPFLPVWRRFLQTEFKPNLQSIVGKFPKLGSPRMFPIAKTGPTTYSICGAASGFVNSSVYALVLAARVWLQVERKTGLYKAFTDFISNFPDSKTFISRMESMAMATHPTHDSSTNPNFNSKEWVESQYLGRLGFKTEPAGKIRVFAMVDAWTQWLMSPLHDWIFSILRRIPQDGTFDQMSPVELLQNKYSQNPKGLFSSIDLSAATDRLPISLQKVLLEVLLEDIIPDSKLFSESWADLLVKRDYEIPEKVIGTILDWDKPSVRYSVGQPMGALSSWAMLALTHHAMMQFSASKRGKWFTDYAVLGDDGVIKGSLPTTRYQQLLSKIGVKAGLAKSILAKNRFVIEFAKKFFVDATTANMLPFKESVATMASTSLVVEFVRKYNLTLNSILSFLGYGFKTKSKAVHSAFFKLNTRLRVLLVWLSHPNSSLGKSTYVEWLFQKSWTSYHPFKKEVILECLRIMNSKNQEKSRQLLDSYNKYWESISKIDKVYDELYPITFVNVQTSALDGFVYSKDTIPWRAILSPSLGPSDIEINNTVGMSQHKYRYTHLQSLDLGLKYDEYMAPIYDVLYNRSSPDLSKLGLDSDTTYILSMLEDSIWLQDEMDELKGSIPEKFWVEERIKDRPFRDFLNIYKFWQDLSRPIWASSYGKEIKLFSIPTRHVPERGSKEEPVQSLPLIVSNPRFSWIEFIFGCLIGFILLDRLYDPPVLFVVDLTTVLLVPYESADGLLSLCLRGYETPLSNLLDTELLPATKDNSPSVSSETLVLSQQSKAGLVLMGLGVSILLIQVFVVWYLDAPWAAILPWTPWMEVPTTEIVGPLSIDQLGFLQVQLENRALLDNLAISPIGDLWIDPW